MLSPSSRIQRGVTLVEVAVVMVIMGIMFAYALPELRSWMRSLKVRNAGESVLNGLNIARMEALKRNGAVAFWLVSDANPAPTNACVRSSSSAQWVVAINDPAGKCGAGLGTDAAPLLLSRSKAQEYSSKLTVVAKDASGTAVDRVAFNGLGQVQQVAGVPSIQTVDITSTETGARRLRVVVESGGAVRLCDRDVAAGDPRACPAL
jgi:type IV fimbrial biogenesis protein FimT